MKNHTILLVCSSGGHLVKLNYLKNWWGKYHRHWITKNDLLSNSLLKNESVTYGYFPENRNLINFFRNFFLAVRYFAFNKPNLVFSNGAGVAPPFFMVAKLLGIKTVFMETFIFHPRPTLSGKIIYRFADCFIVQNKKLLSVYPKAKYWGAVV